VARRPIRCGSRWLIRWGRKAPDLAVGEWGEMVHQAFRPVWWLNCLRVLMLLLFLLLLVST